MRKSDGSVGVVPSAYVAPVVARVRAKYDFAPTGSEEAKAAQLPLKRGESFLV